jgi:hypothetical protein
VGCKNEECRNIEREKCKMAQGRMKQNLALKNAI